MAAKTASHCQWLTWASRWQTADNWSGKARVQLPLAKKSHEKRTTIDGGWGRWRTLGRAGGEKLDTGKSWEVTRRKLFWKGSLDFMISLKRHNPLIPLCFLHLPSSSQSVSYWAYTWGFLIMAPIVGCGEIYGGTRVGVFRRYGESPNAGEVKGWLGLG